jgi:hypothetical protein
MRKALALLLVIAATAVVALPSRELHLIKKGYVTSSMFRDAGPSEQRAYVMGIVDGLFLAPLFGAPERRGDQLQDCITGLNLDDLQLAALVRRELEEDATLGSSPAHIVVFRAIRQTCLDHGYPFD